MTAALFARITKNLLTVFGQEAFLRQGEPCLVNIEHGVQMVGPDEMTVVHKSVATIAQTMDPKVGDLLTHPDGVFRLDSERASNGHSKRFVLLPAQPSAPGPLAPVTPTVP